MHFQKDPFVRCLKWLSFCLDSHHFRQPAAVPLRESTHEGSDVPIYARGPWSHLFTSTHEQHYIFHVITHAACLSSNRQHAHCRSGRHESSSSSRVSNSADSFSGSNGFVASMRLASSASTLQHFSSYLLYFLNFSSLWYLTIHSRTRLYNWCNL